MTRFVVTDHAFGATTHEQQAAERTGAQLQVHQVRDPEATTEVVLDADVVFVNFAPIGREQLAAMAPGALVIRYGVGYNNVDVEAATELGVQVVNVPDYGIETVADHASAMLLSLLRRIPAYGAGIREQGWITPPDVGPIPALADTTVGLLGAGRIAQSLAARLQVFGITTIAHDPFADASALASKGIELVDLDQVLARSHGISLHLPSTEQTRGMLDDAAFAAMRPGMVVVNTSRGDIINQAALARAIASGRVAGAGLDVFEVEPLPADSPLRQHPMVLLSPHAAFYSERSLDALQSLAADEAVRHVNGEPPRSPVNTLTSPTSGKDTHA